METSCVRFPPCCGKGSGGFCHPSLPLLLLLVPLLLCPMGHSAQMMLSREAWIGKQPDFGFPAELHVQNSTFSPGRHLKAS